MTHITWSVENNGKCPTCDSETILVVAPEGWQAHFDERHTDQDDDWAEVVDEVSGHYCRTCRRLVSLSLNAA
jgi:wobble nucleotide-excising tRNase